MTNIQQKYENIQKNRKIHAKPMSEAQLKTILKFIAKYDMKFDLDRFVSVIEANEIIMSLSNQASLGKLKKRVKPYNPVDLFIKYIDKYPHHFKEILKREL